MSHAKTDREVIAGAIDSMRQGCGCARQGLPPCQDKRCPNSPAWGGLIQFGYPDAEGNWRDPSATKILEGNPEDPYPFDGLEERGLIPTVELFTKIRDRLEDPGLPSRSMVSTDIGNQIEDPAWRELGNAHRVLRVAVGESVAAIARRLGLPERAVVDMEHGRENPAPLLEPLYAELRGPGGAGYDLDPPGPDRLFKAPT